MCVGLGQLEHHITTVVCCELPKAVVHLYTASMQSNRSDALHSTQQYVRSRGGGLTG